MIIQEGFGYSDYYWSYIGHNILVVGSHWNFSAYSGGFINNLNYSSDSDVNWGSL